MFTKMIQRMPTKASEEEIENLAERCGLSFPVAEVLLARGIDTVEKVKKFLSPGTSDLHDPFLMKGMRELVDRLQEAIDNGETVVVYGDYDADGICATAIFAKFLSSRGVNVVPYIPSRKSDGYGVTLFALERLIDEYLPDLILTCDCGISAHDEIAAIADSGIDVVVTDHHELPRVLPGCVCLDPKMPDGGYPFDGLCGAGVALKVVQAMAGVEGVLAYVDLAAVATVADLVPLVDENRAIVSIGLARINRGDVNRGLAALLSGMGMITATDIAYRVAPRINAAGRMGDAYRAFQLLISDSPEEIARLTASIDADNVLRKETCNRVYAEAIALIRQQDLSDSYCLVLGHPDWEKGLTSIVAAQIAGEYKRPAFLIVRNGTVLKGTARSVEGVNLYDLLRACEDLLIEYGGHAQAAGFSIEEKNVEAFRARADDYLHRHFSPETFLPNGCYDADLDARDIAFPLAKELDKLEPFGNGNPRPIFRVAADDPEAEPMRSKPAHLVIRLGKVNVNAFNYARCYPIFREKGRFYLNVELSVNRYQGRDFLSATLRDFDFERFGDSGPSPLTDTSAFYALCRADVRHEVETISEEKILGFLDGARFGTLFVAYTRETYREFVDKYPKTQRLWHSIYTRESVNNYSRIVLAPTPDFDAGGYGKIVLLDAGVDPSLLAFRTDPGACIFLAEGASRTDFHGVSCKRDVFVKCFRALKDDAFGSDLTSALNEARKELPLRQTVVCYAVFKSLGLAEYDPCQARVIVDRSAKRDLSESAGYRLLEAKNDG